MNKKEIIILAAIGAGVYILSQMKAMKTYIAPQYPKTAAEKVAEKVAEEENEYIRERTPSTPAVPMPRRIAEKIPDAATPAARRRIAEKIATRKRTAEKIAFTPKIKLAISILSVPEKIHALVAYRKKIAAEKKVSPQSISLTPDQRARVLLEAAIKKAAVRKAAAQKIKRRRAAMAWYAKRQRPQIQRPNPKKKQTTSKLFPGAERSRIIPYSESSRHSYYGPKSHKVLNSGYMEKRYKAEQKQAHDAEMEELRNMFPSDWA